MRNEYFKCASIPIGLEDGDLKSLGGSHSACWFESNLAHQWIATRTGIWIRLKPGGFRVQLSGDPP